MLETERIIANSHMISGESLPIIGPQAPQRHKSHFFDSTQFKKIFYFYCFKNYLFIFWLHWVFVASRAFTNCSKWGLLSSSGAQASHCSTGSRHMSFSCSSWIPDCSNRGTQAELCLSMQSSAPGIEPVSPALAGGFLSTVLPGKS